MEILVILSGFGQQKTNPNKANYLVLRTAYCVLR